MSLYESVRALASTSAGDGSVDWNAVTEAAKAATTPGSLAMTPAEEEGYASDVRDARARIREVADLEFDVPRVVEVQNRHHWIDANVDTFRRVLDIFERQPRVFPGAARVVNTATMATTFSFLANNVLGQYDPLLLAEGAPDHRLYFVHPNVQRVARVLDVPEDRFRRWIAFHEVSHAAEFGAAPWLPEHLEAKMEAGLESLAHGGFDRHAFQELDTTMTAVEGYAELLMDHAFDDEYQDLRDKLEERRRGRTPLSRLLRRLLGMGLKRRQYERGKAFFESVAASHGIATANLVWERPENLPTAAELDDPGRWLARVA
ncbi:zinc-dependent metalloprotease [Halobacteriaceae archaeon GCM10025711]